MANYNKRSSKARAAEYSRLRSNLARRLKRATNATAELKAQIMSMFHVKHAATVADIEQLEDLLKGSRLSAILSGKGLGEVAAKVLGWLPEEFKIPKREEIDTIAEEELETINYDGEEVLLTPKLKDKLNTILSKYIDDSFWAYTKESNEEISPPGRVMLRKYIERSFSNLRDRYQDSADFYQVLVDLMDYWPTAPQTYHAGDYNGAGEVFARETGEGIGPEEFYKRWGEVFGTELMGYLNVVHPEEIWGED